MACCCDVGQPEAELSNELKGTPPNLMLHGPHHQPAQRACRQLAGAEYDLGLYPASRLGRQALFPVPPDRQSFNLYYVPGRSVPL